eukprot:Hpha_TRINITY_DN3544_c0_g1::TRINITY_DN3544_c0_g1_i1::g.25745::m.25745
MDAEVGRLMEVLRRDAVLGRRTLVVFSSDNGPEDSVVYFRAMGSTGPFRGRKRSLYEGGVRVPFVAWWPGTVPRELSATTVSALDWFPTVLDLAGAPLPPSMVTGRSAKEVLLGGKGAIERPSRLKWD